MAFNINNFKANGVVYGGARPSLFKVTLNTPEGLALSPDSKKKFEFTCKSAELPGSMVSSVPIPYFGRSIKVAGQRDFQDWSVSVINDEDFSVRALFEAWSNSLNRHVSNLRDSLVDEEHYKVDLVVEQYGKDGSIIRSYKLEGAFPTMISPIGLDWSSANQIEEFGVTFSYDLWVPEVEQSAKKAGGTNVYGDKTTAVNSLVEL